MSDTDDTDVLLLIPPDFFLVHSDSDITIDENWSDHCRLHCNLVEDLAGEVCALKTRLNSIENSSEVTSPYQSIDSISTDMSNRNFQFNDVYHNQRYMASSAKSTPQKPRTKLIGNSLPSTPSTERNNPRKNNKGNYNQYETKRIAPHKSHSTQSIQTYYDRDADESSINTSPEKRENKAVLGEIDQFLSHVKTIKRYVTQRKLENSFPTSEKPPQSLPISFDNSPLKLSDLKGEGDTKAERRRTLDLKEVNKLLQAMETQQQKMVNPETLPEINRIVEGNEAQTHTWKPGENKNSVPDYELGMRDIMYAQEDNRKLSDTIHEYIASKCKGGSHLDYNQISDLSDSTDNTTPPTVFERHSDELLSRKPQKLPSHSQHINAYEYIPQHQNVFEYVTQQPPQKLEHNHKLTEEELIKKSVQSNIPFAPRHKKNPVFHYENDAANKNLFGLVDLWNYNQKGDNLSHNTERNSNIISKLEEEKMRRQHCEKLIQDLQLKHLEMQQRLAVAVQVDCAKDAAILRFHEAWEKVADRWQALETERNQLVHKLSNVKGRSDSDIAEATKKVVHYESEMSKALDLAHTNQEKCNNLEFEKNSIQTELDSVNSDLESVKKKLQGVETERKELREKYSELEKVNIQDKKLLTDLQKEMTLQKQKSHSDLTCMQSEVKHLREEKSKLEKEVQDSLGSCDILESKNISLENAVENSKKNEKILQHEISKLLDQQDKAKIDLRNFYQQQVEILVKDKLKEFQSQLEQTEKSLHDELQNREQNIAKTAAKQLQKLTDKHQLEIKLLEEKHKEEINLYDIQINQLKHLIATQQNKLDQMQMKRNNIAQELKSVMEAQWNEALRIINNGRTPAGTPKESKLTASTRYQNYDGELEKKLLGEDLRHEQPENEKHRELPRTNVALVSTPLSARSYREMSNSSNDLQKYIKMLLDKEPGNPTEEDVRRGPFRDTASCDCNDISLYAKVSGPDVGETDKQNFVLVSKEHRSNNKPPWK